MALAATSLDLQILLALVTMARLLLFIHVINLSISWSLIRVLTLQGCDLVLQLQDLILVVLVCLLDIFLVLVHALFELALVLQIFGLLGELLDVG